MASLGSLLLRRLIALFWFLSRGSFQQVDAFVSPSRVLLASFVQQEHHDGTTTNVLLEATTTTTTTTTDASSSNSNKVGESIVTPFVTPMYWDFQGHSCYAEISKPVPSASSSTKSSLAFPFFFNEKNNNNNDLAKPEVLLIHGFACSTTYWRETTTALTNAGFIVHAIDLLGQGRSTKPGRTDGVRYSIDLWARQVDDYSKRYLATKTTDVVLVGNSLGSVVALSVATGNCYNSEEDSETGSNENEKNNSFLTPRVCGLCLFNCGVGMNTRNVLKELDGTVRVLVSALFDLVDRLVFDNPTVLTYIFDNLVTEGAVRSALLNLYACADDPESRVDSELVQSFLRPVVDDTTPAVVEVLRQIYTNDPGKTPMELHQEYPTFLESLPIHLIWGNADTVTPLSGSVGTFYSGLAANHQDDIDSTDGNSNNVSMQVVKAGHLPFDEQPKCNQSLLDWLEQVVLPRTRIDIM